MSQNLAHSHQLYSQNKLLTLLRKRIEETNHVGCCKALKYVYYPMFNVNAAVLAIAYINYKYLYY